VPEHPNATLVREALRAFHRGDLRTAMDSVTDDVEWHEIGAATPVRGKDELARLYSGVPEPDADLTTEIHDVVAGDEHVVALVQATARRGARSLTYRTAEILHVRDGKIAARWAFSDDTAAITEFFANR
jgi:ketosteroid isomerase-like protein